MTIVRENKPKILKLMNQMQEIAYCQVLNGHNVVISGQGGTGKSFLVKEIHDAMKSAEKKRIYCVQYGNSVHYIPEYTDTPLMGRYTGWEIQSPENPEPNIK